MRCRRTRSARAFGACLLTAVLGIAACGDDEETETPAVVGPVTLTITEVSARNNEWVAVPTEESLKLGCDRTLAVRITIDPARNFTLRPIDACGSLEQCGIVRFDLLDESGAVLASKESATSAGLIALGDASPEAVTVSATLLHGKDDETVEFEQAGEVVRASAQLSLLAPAAEDCEVQGNGGAAMAAGGAAGSGTGGATELGGAGGRDPDEGSAGIGGSDGGTQGAGGFGGSAGTSGGGTAGSLSLGGGGTQG